MKLAFFDAKPYDRPGFDAHAAVTVDNLLKVGRGEPSPDTEVCAPKEQDQRRS